MSMYGMPTREGALGVRGVGIGVRMQDEFECDEVRINVSFSGEAVDAPKATELYREVRAKVVLGLIELGVAASAITDRPPEVYPKREDLYRRYVPRPNDRVDPYSYRGNRLPVIADSGEVDLMHDELYRIVTIISGYVFSAGVNVVIPRDLGIHEAAYDFLANLSEKETDAEITFGMSYGLRDENMAQKALMKVAVEKARAEAEALAEAAGERIDKVQEIIYETAASGYGAGASEYARMKSAVLAGGDGVAEEAFCVSTACAPVPAQPSAPDLNPHPITVSCDVSTVWRF